MKNHTNAEFNARASRAGYIVFGVIYGSILLIPVYAFFCGNMKCSSSDLPFILVPLSMLFGMYAWLLGFKIRITPDQFEYRDGLWRWHSCPLDEVREVKHTWVEFKNLGRTLKLPRMVVSRYDLAEKPILINSKPFSREDIVSVRGLLGDRISKNKLMHQPISKGDVNQ